MVCKHPTICPGIAIAKAVAPDTFDHVEPPSVEDCTPA